MAAIGLRAWTLDADDYEDEAAFRSAVIEELAASEYLGYRLGVAVVSAPIRREVTPGEWVTVGWLFRTATVPGVPRAEEPVAAEDEPVGEREAVEPELADVSY